MTSCTQLSAADLSAFRSSPGGNFDADHSSRAEYLGADRSLRAGHLDAARFSQIVALFFTVAIFLSGRICQAVTLNTSYLNIELPVDWACQQVKQSWACFPSRSPDLHTASLVVSAKEAAPEETLALLSQQLKSSKVITKKNGSPLTSRSLWARPAKIAGLDSFEALHQDRELEGYTTYYLTTLADGLSVALVLSAQTDRVAQLNRWIEQIKQTLSFHVPTKPQLAERPQAGHGIPTTDQAGGTGGARRVLPVPVLPEPATAAGQTPPTKGLTTSDADPAAPQVNLPLAPIRSGRGLAVALAVVAVLALIVAMGIVIFVRSRGGARRHK